MAYLEKFDGKVRFLNPEDLTQVLTRQKEFTLPTVGAKETTPTGSWVEAKHVQSRLRNLHDITAYPRVNQRSQLSEAAWDKQLHRAKVSKAIGKHWETMGSLVDSQLCLYPEEALFMMECNNLEVTYDGIAMSLQQSYEMMLDKDCTLEEYLTYSMLSRQGYKVVRHQGDLGITSYERQIRLDRYQRKRKKDSQGPSEVKQQKLEEVEILEEERGSSPEIVEEVTNETFECVDLTLDSDEEKKESNEDAVKIEDPPEEESLLDGPLAPLWRLGNTVPKLSPKDATTVSNILSKLALKNKSNQIVTSANSHSYKISFDLYLPNVRLRKSIPKLPNYRIVVCKPDSKVPTADDLQQTLGTLKDGVPLLFAICSLSNTSFFCFSEVNLPSLVSHQFL